MMFTGLFGLASAAALASSVVHAAPVLEPRASTTACYTTHTGRVLYGPNDPYGLNSANQMIYPSTGTALTVLLQACPNATYATYNPTYESYGARLVAVEGGSIGANQCLTTLQSPSDSNIFYMHLTTCGSNTNPPTSQAFVLDTNDFGHEIWHIENSQYQGPAEGDNGPLTTSGTDLVKWRHTNAIGESYTSIVIEGYTA